MRIERKEREEMEVPEGFLFSAVSCGIKEPGKPDMGLVFSNKKLTAWGVFTKNSVKAVPVILGKKFLKRGEIRGILANSGVANACTGEEGFKRAESLLGKLSRILNVSEKSILPASTGVIGEQLPVEKMSLKLEELVKGLAPEKFHSFAEAIMTTDTFPKVYFAETSEGIRILGIAKGAGMIAPNMATMLGFIFTDAEVSREFLKKFLKKLVEETFNRISVDGDTSTNDTVYMLCSNKKMVKDLKEFEKKCLEVADKLAYFIAKDGEGATKIIKIKIKGAKNKQDARKLAEAVANSPLVKTAFYGCDPNWGRIFSALGKTGIKFSPENVELYLNSVPWIKNLKLISDEKKLKEEMRKNEVELFIKLKEGRISYEFYTCDFTENYIKINANYRT